jgi:hypothetical protein
VVLTHVTQVPPRFCQGKKLTNRREVCEGEWNGVWGGRRKLLFWMRVVRDEGKIVEGGGWEEGEEVF